MDTWLHLPHHQCPHLYSKNSYCIVGTNAYETTGSQVSIQQIKANSYYYYHHGAGIHIILCGYFRSYCKGPCPSPSPFFIRYGNCLDVDLHKLKINEFKLQKISSTLTFYSAWIFQSFLVLVILYYLTCHLYHPYPFPALLPTSISLSAIYLWMTAAKWANPK